MQLIGPIKVNEKYGYITSKGDPAFDPVFEELGEFSDGMISFKKGNQVGFLDADGNVKIPPKFDYLDSDPMPVFRSGLAAIRHQNKVGYINATGEWQIPPSWFWGWNFLDSQTVVESKEGYFILNYDGSISLQLKVYDVRRQADWIKSWDCFKCLFLTKNNGFHEGCINSLGEIVFGPIYKRVTEFHQGVAGFCDEEDSNYARWGLVNFRGDIVAKPQYLDMGDFSEGLSCAANTTGSTGFIEAYGYIDIHGDWAISPRFQWAFRFVDGIARVAVGGVFNNFYEQLVPVRYGYTDRKGEFIIEHIYSWARDFESGFAIVCRNGIESVIDRKGRVIFSTQ